MTIELTEAQRDAVMFQQAGARFSAQAQRAQDRGIDIVTQCREAARTTYRSARIAMRVEAA